MADEKTALTTRIVAAYLRSNNLAASDIPDLIRVTYAALVGVSVQEKAPEPLQPAVSVRKSVTPDAITCLECGKSQKMLKRHLMTAHGLTVDDYRSKWSLAADYPMVSSNYAQHRSRLAINIGLGRKRTTTEPEKSELDDATAKPRNRYPASRWSRPTE